MEEKIMIPESQLAVSPAIGVHMWDLIKYGRDEDGEIVSLDPDEERYLREIGEHMAWISSIPHEVPSPYHHFKIGVYIRFFNQTKYDNYLDYHKAELQETIALCPNWEFVDFYVDYGANAPNMESAKEWNRLLNDCMSGRVDLIITQKVSNVSRNPMEMSFCARMLAAQPHPVGIYFISEDLFTLATYYQFDLRDEEFLPVSEQASLKSDIMSEGGQIIENNT